MAQSEEPPEKRARTEINYKLCIKCQSSKKEQLKEPPPSEEHSTYDKFLTAIRLRASFGNSEYVTLSEKIGDLTAGDLNDKHVVWHRTCYAASTNKEHIKRDEKRYRRACATSDVSLLHRTIGRPAISSHHEEPEELSVSERYTRSKSMKYDKSKCFFCQGKVQGVLHECQSGNVGTQIHDIVQHSNNPEWKVNYACVISDNDALSQDIVYHKQCITEQWQLLKRELKCGGDGLPSSKTPISGNTDDSVHYIAAEIEFFAEIQERIEQGEIIPIDEAERDYVSKMKQHNIEYRSGYSNAQTARRLLRQKIEKNVKFVQFTPLPNKPTLIHSKAKQNAAVGEAVDRPDLHDDMRKIFEASMVIRKSIEQAKKDPWVFNGTLENSSEDVVPHELHSMILWILKGMYTVKTEARTHDLNQSATVISQQILQAHKSNRQILYEPKSPTAAFRSTMETPITLGISLYCDHKWRSHKLASLLSHAGVGVPYQRVKQCITQIAKGVQENMEKHDGNYVPPGLHRQQRLRFSLDNVDAQVDTPDGRNSFHATAMAVYQREPSVEDAIDVVVEYVTPTQNKSARSLKKTSRPQLYLLDIVQYQEAPNLQLARTIQISR